MTKVDDLYIDLVNAGFPKRYLKEDRKPLEFSSSSYVIGEGKRQETVYVNTADQKAIYETEYLVGLPPVTAPYRALIASPLNAGAMFFAVKIAKIFKKQGDGIWAIDVGAHEREEVVRRGLEDDHRYIFIHNVSHSSTAHRMQVARDLVNQYKHCPVFLMVSSADVLHFAFTQFRLDFNNYFSLKDRI